MDGFRLELLATEPVPCRHRIFRKGEVLWSRDEALHSVFLVRRGEVEIVAPGRRNHETVLRLIKPGEICGLFCLCQDRRDSAPTTGRAGLRTEAVEIGCDDFIEYLRTRPDAALAVLITACDRLAFAEERIQIMARRGAEDRLVALLLQLSSRAGRPGPEPGLVRVQYTHAQLARLAGMNRAHVSLVLSRLRAAGVVSYGRGEPMHVNFQALAEYAAGQQVQAVQARPRRAAA